MLDESKRAFMVAVRTREIDHSDTSEEYRRFVAFIDEHYGFHSHYYRFCNTFHLMLASGLDVGGKVVIETGHPCPITQFLAEMGAHTSSTRGDLRYAIEAEDASADVLVSFEVMEHIKDQTEKKFDDVVLFNESGVQRFASEIVRVLKPGGVLYLTTPNACSLYATMQILRHEPPVLFRPHVREYSRPEVTRIFSALTVETYISHYSIFQTSLAQRAPLLKRYFTDLGYSDDDRGDLHFFKFRKPLHAIARSASNGQ
jgi:SAM-dependent methyltransferase